MTPQQAEHARKLLRSRLPVDGRKASRSEMTASKLAKAIGRDKSYLNDFLDGSKQSLAAGDIIKIEQHLELRRGELIGVAVEDLRRVPLDETFDADPPGDFDENVQIAVRAHRNQLAPGEIPERDVIGGMGEGGDIAKVAVDGEILDGVRAWWRLPPEFIRYQLHARQADLDFIPVEGDSMEPTLTPGDRVLVNRGHTDPSPDGLYAIHNGIGVVVKRLEVVFGPGAPQIRVISDNQSHNSYTVPASDLRVIGRVICRVTQC